MRVTSSRNSFLDPFEGHKETQIDQKSTRSRPCFRSRFWSNLDPTLDSTWGHLGAQDGAMLGPCWGQELIFRGSREQQKTDMIFDTFRGPLGDDFGTMWSSKIDPKSVQNRSHERSSRKGKNVKNHKFFNCFCGLGGWKIDQKSVKIEHKIDFK